VHVCLVAWRAGPAILSVTAVGVPGTVDPSAIVALAERQQAHAGNLA
jgi:hypothetical protein